SKLDESAATPLRRPTALNVFWEGQSPKNNISLFWSISHSSPKQKGQKSLGQDSTEQRSIPQSQEP
ncbi:12515_t:CDS:1, partial [Funneliformis caledonium]